VTLVKAAHHSLLCALYTLQYVSTQQEHTMWDEINDMEGEIFDRLDVDDDMPSILSLTDEDINQLIDEHEANTDDNN